MNFTHAISLRRIIYKTFLVYKALYHSPQHNRLWEDTYKTFLVYKTFYYTFSQNRFVRGTFTRHSLYISLLLQRRLNNLKVRVKMSQKNYTFESLILSVFMSHCFKNNVSRHLLFSFFRVRFLAPLCFVFQVPFFVFRF